MKKYMLIGGLLIAMGLPAQETTKLTATKHSDYGLVYTLPLTAIDIEAEVTRITAKAGPYYQYAEKYLGMPVTITEDAEYWELNNIHIVPRGIPDKNEEYLVKFKPGFIPYIYLNKDGIILSVNTEPAPPAVSVTEKPQENTTQADSNPSSVFTEELLMSGSTAKMAEIAAKQLYRIRESRLDIVTGNVEQLPADGESFKLVLNQLNQQEEALTALFMGTIKKEKITRTFRIIPEDAVKNEVIFRFSKYLGIVEKDNLAGSPVYMNLEITEEGEPPVDEKGRVKERPKGGLAYCIPGKARVEIRTGEKKIAGNEIQVSQFGTIFAFPSDLFDNKKAPAQVTFYPETGAIRQLSAEQK